MITKKRATSIQDQYPTSKITFKQVVVRFARKKLLIKYYTNHKKYWKEFRYCEIKHKAVFINKYKT